MGQGVGSMKLVSTRVLILMCGGLTAGSVVVMAACGSSNSSTLTGSPNEDASVTGSSGAPTGGGSGTASGSAASGSSGSASTGSGTSPFAPPADAGPAAALDAFATYDGPPPNVDGGMLACATPDGLPIKFNPIYSGYDGTHIYQVPVFVEGVDPGTVTWGASDPTMVSLQPYVSGIMITTKKAGDVTIIARMGSQCGSAPLHIASYTVAEWNLGNLRYNNDAGLVLDQDAAGVAVPDGGFDASGFDASGYDAQAACNSPMFANLTNPFENPPAACTNCHGSMSNGMLFGMTLFSDVQHTPEQTGGFSEDDLTNAFINGTIPDGGYFNDTIIQYCFWHKFHTWRDINTTEGQTGMRAYLRSLTPQEQVGCFELFNSQKCADGG